MSDFIVDFTEQILAATKKKQDNHHSEYGDVEYADPARSKYPINSKERVLAAFRYINEPKNQKGYTPAEVAAIKSKIKAKFKQYGIDQEKDAK